MERDAGFLPDDPLLSKMENLLRYMRQHPNYLPPNPWPEGMVLFLCSEKEVVGIQFMTLEKFEKLHPQELFATIDDSPASDSQPRVDVVCFIPCLKLPNTPEEQMRQVAEFIQKPAKEITDLLRYLRVNEWAVVRPKYNAGDLN